jgi:phosphoribosylformimino-5-aminoimidazole carboxamide ribotide isomerase
MVQIIPVLDLMAGRVVRAAGGDRAHYLPWISGLCTNAGPVEAVEGLLRLFPFPVIYIADLDGIEGRGRQTDVVAELVRRFPAVEFWTDNGIADPAGMADWRARGLGRLVLGSENLSAPPAGPLEGCILSLDFKKGCFLGPEALLADAALWPRDVIVMTLDQVGGQGGPDFPRLKALVERKTRSRLYAAGGVRNAGDLESLRDLGVSGALIATALHSGTLGGAAIASLMAGGRGAPGAKN